MIESYSFGRMEINGRNFSSDLIIYPDGRIEDNWWREEGHRLGMADIAGLLDFAPEMIVIGTGASGLMKVDRQLKDYALERKIELVVDRTVAAVAKFNQLIGEGTVGACFHLTC